MKKLVSLILLTVMIFTLCTPSISAYDADIADSVNIEPLSDNLVFSKMQLGKIRVKITNSSDAVSAKALIYIDGHHQADAGSKGFVIYKENNENFDVYIPPILDENVEHTLKLKLIFNDESSKEITFPFTVKKEQAQISAKIVSHPVSVTPGTEIYYRVKFLFSDPDYGYRIRTAISLNGEHIPSLDRVLKLASGEEKTFAIPSELTNVDLYTYDFKITVNPDPQKGESTAHAASSVIMKGEKGKSLQAINSLVKPTEIKALVTSDAPAYDYGDLTGYRTTIPSGTEVIYLNPDSHDSMKSARVKSPWGTNYWIPMSKVKITTGDYVIADELSDEQKNMFVNVNGYESKTSYLVWVNLQRQILSVFIGKKGEWKVLKTFPVATGKNSTPTPTVQHPIQYVTRWETPSYTCYPVLALYNGYAIHNQPVSPSGRVTDPTIGKPASAGCVRMLQEDINWVHAYVPVGTNVVIY